MLLVIFGAGASFDSVDLSLSNALQRRVSAHAIYRPPLANQLFDERPDFINALNAWPQMSSLVLRLRRAASGATGPAIEETLRQIQDEADTYPWRRSHLHALRHYLVQILDEPSREWLKLAGRATNYSGLLDQLGFARSRVADPRWLFVNFNYETLFEAALEDVFSWRIADMDSYTTNDFALIKPHGSVDWLQVLAAERGHPDLPNNTRDLIALASQQPFREIEIVRRGTLQAGVPSQPAIAIPVDQAKTFVCPEEHLRRLKGDLGLVTDVLIIGWRASEQHFLDMLAERLPKNAPINLCIVDMAESTDAVRSAFEGALEHVQFAMPHLHREGFSQFVAQRSVLEWLGLIAK